MVEGWVIQHPSGHLELDYFHVKQPVRRSKDGGLAGGPMEWSEWMLAYRPGCRLLRMKLHEVPAEAEVSHG